jgi:hypothetical protein
MNGQRMECVPGRGEAVRPLLSVGARLIAFALCKILRPSILI